MWTLYLILAILGFLVTKAISQLFHVNRSIYPSDAFIDQIIPPEVLEQIFLNLDYDTIFECKRVSKYWRYNASNKRVLRQLCNSQRRISPQELLQHSANKDWLNLDYIHLIKYPESYDPVWQIKDHVLARKLDKKLIDQVNNASIIHNTMRSKGDNDGADPTKKWLVKTRARTYSFDFTSWTFTPLGIAPEKELRFFTVDHGGIPKYTLFKDKMECELIVDLDQLEHQSPHITKIHHLRYLNEKFWLGLQMDNTMFIVFVVLFGPCFLADYWQLNLSVNYWINLTFALLCSVIILFFAYQSISTTNIRSSHFQIDRTWLLTFAYSTIAIILYFYNWMLEIGFLVGCGGGSLGYFFMQQDLFIQNIHAKQITSISAILILLLFDWRLIAETIASGRFFATLGYNTLLLLIGGVLIVIWNGVIRTLESRDPFVKNLFKWTRSGVKAYIIMFGLTVLFTLFSPDKYPKIRL